MPNDTTPSPALPGGVSARVLEHFTKHPGEVLYLADIVEATGLTAKQVQNAAGSLRYRDTAGAAKSLVTVVGGHAWRWSPQPEKPAAGTPPKRVFGEVGATMDGSVILQDADTGTLWRAVQI